MASVICTLGALAIFYAIGSSNPPAPRDERQSHNRSYSSYMMEHHKR